MKKAVKILFVFVTLLIASGVSAQVTQPVKNEAPDTGSIMTFELIVLFVIVNLVFIPLIFDFGDAAEEKSKKKSVFETIKNKISGLKPVSEEHSLLIDEEHDGIQELDNNVPPWFNILFYGTIVIAVIYMLNYHVFKTGKLPFQEYADEIAEAELVRNELIRTGAFINENSVVLLNDAESLNSGKQIFSVNCTPCHGLNAEGTVGPNLTDPYWIHGGGIKNVFKTIKYGVPEKGMITWKNQFNPKTMQQVASYVLSLQGNSPPNAKVAEGSLYIDSTLSAQDSLKSKDIKKDSVITNTQTKK